MSVKLTWNNPNTVFDEVRVYRSETPFDYNAMPTPLASVTTGNTYDDTTAVRNQLYYYVLGVVSGTDEVLSPPKLIANMPYTGPGPQRLLRGDWKRGYFGEVPAVDIFTGTELSSTLNITIGTLTPGADTTVWHKFVHDGKILFMPTLPIRHTVTWESLYNSGIVFGTGDTGPSTAAATGVLQNATVSRDGHLFKVRLPRAQRDADYVLNTTIDHEAEWNALMLPLMHDYTDSPHRHWSDIPMANYTYGSVALRHLMMEHSTTHILATSSASKPEPVTSYGKTYNSGITWRPVLELIL